ncbi:DsbA family protein [Pseudactinotalea sp. Z1739]|uniref:DsbA family protein n=1 Tax=Pseudactinotalea sp. Z1739 TaxID=3413028 RepID=UPI003C7ED09D
MVQQDNPQSRAWVVPAVVLGLVALMLAMVFLLRGGSSEQTGPQEPAGTNGAAQTDPGQDGADEGSDAAGPEAGDGTTQEPGVQGPPARVEGPEQPETEGVERRDADELLAAGPADAPVVLVVFSDYQCPFCAQWSAETLPVMMEYVDAGDLRIEWRDVNVFGEESERAARASYAAALQGGFWEYHEALFPDGQIRSHRELSEDGLTELAVEEGLDEEQFTADLNAPETAEEIDRNAQLGLDLGAYSTPTFILDGQPIIGAQPTEVFTDAVEAALAAATG